MSTPVPPSPRHTRPIQKVISSDNTPTAKVSTAGLAGSAVTILIFIAGKFDLEIDGGTGAALATWLAFAAAYLKKSRPEDFDL